jgi:GNAT superfamily N-acetyltransferase
MVLELDALGPPPSGPDLDVQTEGCAAALGEINDRAFRNTRPAFARLLANAEDAHRLYVGRVDGTPACALAIHDHGDDAMVALVATDPAFQRRGLASKLLHVALLDARERGRRISTLQASRAGEPVYARFGYSNVGRFTMWERRAS